jgi:4a-hydroxytetrahydrobiopterin dehydratase
MTERITPRQFYEAVGVGDWRWIFGGACAHFRTGPFAAGVALVDAIGGLADAANHHPDVDLRSDGVTVRLRENDDGGLNERDVALARQISAAARELNVPADPTAVQTVQVSIDALVRPEVMPFWRAVLGYREMGDEDLLDPTAAGRRSGSRTWTRRARSAIASTSTSPCRTTRPRRASRRRSPPAATW